jgi:large subunit ribosomal protein L6
MSRIGIQPIKIKEGVNVEISSDKVKISGPKGDLEENILKGLDVREDNGHIVVSRKDELQQTKSNHGTMRSLIRNMIDGVAEGYKKELELVGMGYRAEMQGSDLVMYLGWTHPVKISPPEDINIEVRDQVFVDISGADKQKVGLWAAKIRKIRKPEPYKGKGIKYVDEIIRRKTSKAVKEQENG